MRILFNATRFLFPNSTSTPAIPPGFWFMDLKESFLFDIGGGKFVTPAA
jgi:hypothetical protein